MPSRSFSQGWRHFRTKCARTRDASRNHKHDPSTKGQPQALGPHGTKSRALGYMVAT
jgi:hypothetical protein